MKILDQQNISYFICVKKFHSLKKICFGKKTRLCTRQLFVNSFFFIKIDGLRLDAPIIACFYITQPF